jgi:hypothetical protein
MAAPSRPARVLANAPKAVRYAGQVITVFGALNEAEATASLLRQHNEGEFNQGTNFTAVVVLGVAAGVLDDALAAAETGSFGAPVVTSQSWDQHGSGPVQHAVGEAYRAILKWGYSSGF